MRKANNRVGGNGVRLWAIVLFIAQLDFAPSYAVEPVSHPLSLPRQQASVSLSTLADIFDQSLLYSNEDLQGVVLDALAGSYTLPDALEILLKDTPLSAVVTERDVIVISIASNSQDVTYNEESKMEKKSLFASMMAFLFSTGTQQVFAEGVVADSETIKSLEEVVVTASKSGAQSLQETPLAIQAFGAEELKLKNIADVGDLIQLIPGASENQTTSVVARSYNIRGVGSSSTNGDSPIGYYIDDVPFSIINFGIAPPLNFVDVEQVEVLRGPQGTLYGQGAAGGTIIFRTKDPDLEGFRAEFNGSTSWTDQAAGNNYGFNAAVSIPLIEDQLALRISGSNQTNHGWADLWYGTDKSAISGTPDEQDINGDRKNDVRAVLLWEPNDKVRLRAQAWKFETYQDSNNLFDSLEPIAIVSSPEIEGYSKANFSLYSLVGEFDLDSVIVNSATSYLTGEFSSLFPLRPDGYLDSQFFPELFNQEVRVRSDGDGPFNWVVGGQYQDAEAPQKNPSEIPSFGLSLLDSANNTLTKNWAVFGEASYELMDGKLIPLVGVRYYSDKRDFDPGTGVVEGDTKNVTTYRINLSYLPTDDLTIFGTVSTGFRAGIVQTALQADLLQADGFPAQVLNEPDTLTNYELGIKYRSPGRGLILGINLYRIEYTDLQFSLTSSAGIGGFSNIGDAESNGVDIEVSWQTPVDGLSFNAVANINDSEFTDIPSQIQTALPAAAPDGDLIGAAPYNFRIDANYTTQITGDTELYMNLGYSRFGDRLMASGRMTEEYDILGATLGIRRDNWTISLFGENLANTNEPVFLFSTGALVADFATIRPRTIGLRMTTSF